MIKKSLQHTILINIAAFIFVFILEALSLWTIKDVLDTDFPIFSHSLSYSVIVMIVIWNNHFILIPFFYDKRRYAIYGVLLVGSIFLGAYLWAFPNWIGISKMFFYLIYTTGTGMAAFFLRRNLLFRRENEEKENLQREMELNYLKAQVNPHFLFNSLNSIYSLSRKQSLETPDLVIQLSELMRYQLESAKKDSVLLKKELEFIENYLLLEEKRLSKRCTIEFLIEGELLDLKISPMLLIPFVENAVKHGAQSTNKQSTIDVSSTVKNAILHFYVVNSKPTTASESKREGLGLENVKRRLDLLYPEAYTLDIRDLEKEYRVHLTIDLGVII